MGIAHVYNVYKDGEMIAEGLFAQDASALTGIPAKDVWSYAAAHATYAGRFTFRKAGGGTEDHADEDTEAAFVRKFGRLAFEQVTEMNRKYGRR